MNHAVARLRAARLARSAKPFLARGGPRGERCAGCRLVPSHCLCALRPAVPTRAGVCLIMADIEPLKPSNTGWLIADVVTDTFAFGWARTEVDPALVALLADPQWQPYVVFPGEFVAAERVVTTLIDCNKATQFPAGPPQGELAPSGGSDPRSGGAWGSPLVVLREICKAFGGVHAVQDVSLNLYAGEVVAVLGHNGAGKSTLMKMLAGAYPIDSGEVLISGQAVHIRTPADAQALGIESIYQTLALADNLDAVANLFLGRELLTRWRTLDDHRMDADARKVFLRLNKNFTNVRTPVRRLSGGQRQVVAISRAIYFNARILIMDEPTAALGPEETAMVGNLVRQLKAEGVGIFLISHDMHDVFALSDRVAVMKNGRLVGTYRTADVNEDEVLGMIIGGKRPQGKAESAL